MPHREASIISYDSMCLGGSPLDNSHTVSQGQLRFALYADKLLNPKTGAAKGKRPKAGPRRRQTRQEA